MRLYLLRRINIDYGHFAQVCGRKTRNASFLPHAQSGVVHYLANHLHTAKIFFFIFEPEHKKQMNESCQSNHYA